MRATLCLLADFDAENFCRDFMVEASERNHLGGAAGNLPRHISLGLPYDVGNWEAYLDFAEKLSWRLSPVDVRLTGIRCAPIGETTGNYSFSFEEDFGLDQLRLDTVRGLNAQLGLSVPEKDGITGSRSITLGFGTAPFESYEDYVGYVDPLRYSGVVLRFDQLGVFYYDSEKITATSFICCRRYWLIGRRDRR